jgi:hypothetical protein
MVRVAWIFSLFIPGLGQIILGQVRRGIFALSGFLTALGMAYWRFILLAPRETTLLGIVRRSLERRPTFVTLVLLLAALFWILGILDTLKLAHPNTGRKARGLISFFFTLSLLLFVLGWQISEIDLPRMVKDFNKAMTPLNRVLWPWKAAVTRDTRVLSARAEILEGEGTPPGKPVPQTGKPYVYAEPTVGVSSKLDEKRATPARNHHYPVWIRVRAKYEDRHLVGRPHRKPLPGPHRGRVPLGSDRFGREILCKTSHSLQHHSPRSGQRSP